MVLPVPAGGYYDMVTRTVSQKLNERLGQPVVVENRVGAGGAVGTAFAASSAPDGYTILFNGIGAMSIFPSLYPKLAYDPVRDFLPIILLSTVPNILVVHPALPARTVKELAALARSRPGELTYASNGNGTTQHLAAEMFATSAGVKLIHVPYNGSAPAVTSMLGGHTVLMFGVATDVMQHVQTGKLRALAVAGEKRMRALSEIPTTAEAGAKGVEIEIWLGAFAPKGTPRELVTRLNAEIGRVLDLPDVRERIAPGGHGEVKGGTPEQFASLVRSENAKWARVVKASGIKAD
ncbi:MAG: Bug family tripartite tricarboxylate transporter substrate binding protein [Gammaproteobacteria bacterium]